MFIVIFEGDCEASVCHTQKEVEELITEVKDDNTDVEFVIYEVGDEQKVNIKFIPQHIEWLVCETIEETPTSKTQIIGRQNAIH